VKVITWYNHAAGVVADVKKRIAQYVQEAQDAIQKIKDTPGLDPQERDDAIENLISTVNGVNRSAVSTAAAWITPFASWKAPDGSLEQLLKAPAQQAPADDSSTGGGDSSVEAPQGGTIGLMGRGSPTAGATHSSSTATSPPTGDPVLAARAAMSVPEVASPTVAPPTTEAPRAGTAPPSGSPPAVGGTPTTSGPSSSSGGTTSPSASGSTGTPSSTSGTSGTSSPAQATPTNPSASGANPAAAGPEAAKAGPAQPVMPQAPLSAPAAATPPGPASAATPQPTAPPAAPPPAGVSTSSGAGGGGISGGGPPAAAPVGAAPGPTAPSPPVPLGPPTTPPPAAPTPGAAPAGSVGPGVVPASTTNTSAGAPPAPVPVSAARAERDAIAAASTAGALRRQAGGNNPLELARRIGAALNVGIIDFGFFWLTGVTTDGRIVVANSYGLAYIPDGVNLPDQVHMATADESIPIAERAKWATHPILALQGWAQHHNTSLRAVVATEAQFADFDPGVAKIVLLPDDIPDSGKMQGRSRLDVIAPQAAAQLASVADAGLTELLPPAPTDPNPPVDDSQTLWFEVAKPLMSTSTHRGFAHLEAFLTYANHAQDLAEYRAHTATDAATQRAAIADWVYWQHVSVLISDAVSTRASV
jgi:hypothetical protein